MNTKKQNIIWGYARVSTDKQELDLQIDALINAGVRECHIKKEVASGKNTERPKLKELLEQVETGDTVVVYKLDRISRSTKHLLELAEIFKQKGVNFKSIQDEINTETAMGKFFFTVMSAIAQLEADIISERTRAGLKAARARGRMGGRPRKPSKAIDKAIKLYQSKEFTLKEIEEATGVSKATLYRRLNEVKNKEKQNA